MEEEEDMTEVEVMIEAEDLTREADRTEVEVGNRIEISASLHRRLRDAEY